VLIDTYSRVATDLRVSLTDRCNLRCTYCMPEEGLQWLTKTDLLTDDEIVRLIDIAVTSLGIEEVRFTGGEPLLRPGLVEIVERVAALTPRPRMSLTTNGIGLNRTATALKAAGLDRVNVSLDTLRPDVFKTLTRRDRHKDVIEGLYAARETGLTPVKVNSVLMPGLNDDEAPDLLAWAVEHDYELRFIEQMPLDAQHGWKRDGMITARDILTSLRTRFELTEEGSQAQVAVPVPVRAGVGVRGAGDFVVADDVLAVDGYVVAGTDVGRQLGGGAVGGIGEPAVRCVDEALVLDADAALVPLTVARVVRHICLSDQLGDVSVGGADQVVGRGTVEGSWKARAVAVKWDWVT
jgi:cyclic pyranopterin phosphate synthase